MKVLLHFLVSRVALKKSKVILIPGPWYLSCFFLWNLSLFFYNLTWCALVWNYLHALSLVFTRSFQCGNLCLWVLDIVLNFFTGFFFTFVFSVPYFWNTDIWLLGILDWSLILLFFLPIPFYLGGLLSGRLKNYLLPTDCLIPTLVLSIFKVFLPLSSLF